jgi:hypothetical protein
LKKSGNKEKDKLKKDKMKIEKIKKALAVSKKI